MVPGIELGTVSLRGLDTIIKECRDIPYSGGAAHKLIFTQRLTKRNGLS